MENTLQMHFSTICQEGQLMSLIYGIASIHSFLYHVRKYLIIYTIKEKSSLMKIAVLTELKKKYQVNWSRNTWRSTCVH